MNPLQLLFGTAPPRPKDGVKALVAFVRKRGTFPSSAAEVGEALRRLGTYPTSGEALECLLAWTSTAMVSQSSTNEAAVEGLGLLGGGPALERIAAIAASTHPSSSWEKASEALRPRRNKAGIATLLGLALTREPRSEVKAALRALAHIGTAEAEEALETFHESPSRRLYETHFELPESRFSSDLGQTPSFEEVALIGAKLGDDIRFGTRERAMAVVKEILEAPVEGDVVRLEQFLSRDPVTCPSPRLGKLTTFPSELTRTGVTRVVEAALADAAARKSAIRQLIASSDGTTFRAFLSEGRRRVDYGVCWLLLNQSLS